MVNPKNLLAITFLILTNVLISQSYPKGAYLSLEEIKAKKPSWNINMTIERRSLSDIKLSGGNDYRLVSVDNSVKKKDIKKKIVGYSQGDTLYINCQFFKVQQWYSPVLNQGRYLLFVGGISQETNLANFQIQETETSMVWSNFGLIGGAIQGAKLAQLRFPYIIDTITNEVNYLDDFQMEKLLAGVDLNLLSEFRAKKMALNKNEDIKQLILTYLDKVNNK